MGRKTSTTSKRKKSENQKVQKQIKDEKEVSELVDILLRLSTTPPAPNVRTALEEQKEISKYSENVCLYQIADKGATDLRIKKDVINNLMVWVRQNGGEYHGVSVDRFPGYDLGLKADEDIAENTLIVAIPRRLMMTVEAAKKTILGKHIERDRILSNMPNVALALFLLFEKFQEDSFWQPYINVLPKEYNTILYFDVKDLEELQGSPTLDSALKQIKSITRQYAYFHRLLSNYNDQVSRIMKEKFTLKEYR